MADATLTDGHILFRRWRNLESEARTNPALEQDARAARAVYEMNTAPAERLEHAAGELERVRALAAKATTADARTRQRIAEQIAALERLVAQARAEIAEGQLRLEQIKAKGRPAGAKPLPVTPRRPAADPAAAPVTPAPVTPAPMSLLGQALTIGLLTVPFWGAVLLVRRR